MNKLKRQTNGPQDRTMHKALHTRYVTGRLYIARKEGWRGLSNINDTKDASVRLVDFIEKSKERLITVTTNSIDNIRVNGTKINEDAEIGRKPYI